MKCIPSSNFPLRDHDVPCSVCYVNTSREAVVMIPEKYTCPQNWSTMATSWQDTMVTSQGLHLNVLM